MKLEDYNLHEKGIHCTMSTLQKSMVRWMVHLVKTDPRCLYTSEQGQALSHFIHSFCANNSNQDKVSRRDDLN